MEDLLELVRDFYNATAYDDSTVCFGCGCVDLVRITPKPNAAASWQERHRRRLAELRPEDVEHLPGCIIQRARAALGIAA